VEHANTDYPRRKRFSVPIAKAKKLPHNCGIKVDFIFPEENHWVLKPKMPWQKSSSNGSRKPCRLAEKTSLKSEVFYFNIYFYSEQSF
jgi:hypothetical protein